MDDKEGVVRKRDDAIMKSKIGSTLTFSDLYKATDPRRNQLYLQKNIKYIPLKKHPHITDST